METRTAVNGHAHPAGARPAPAAASARDRRPLPAARAQPDWLLWQLAEQKAWLMSQERTKNPHYFH